MRWCWALLTAGIVCAVASADDDFEKHIRPLLIDQCLKCHGPAKQSGGLRLDSRQALLAGGATGPAIVPGKPADSLLLKAVNQTGELKMPPKTKLAAKDIERLTLWIANGAVWPDSSKSTTLEASEKQRRWWAFQPPKTTTVPAVANEAWLRTDIDRFILAELEKRSIVPAPAADRRTLLRRMTLDVTGLPPTPEEVDASGADQSSNAIEKVVDRLLASPAYGQRWARHWLDVVRYADYHDGNPKARNPVCEPLEAWRFRDWVVQSFNRDLPFDRFIRHQIAGDLLPAPDGQQPDADGLIATTFLVNGAWDRGDADKEKMVSDMVDDQIDTVGKAFMGLTLGCARCHDHKFDPIAQTDYYALAGIFYSTRMLAELGTKGGEMTLQRRSLLSKEAAEKRAAQLKKIADLNAKLAGTDPKSPKSAPDDPKHKALVEERDRLQKELPLEPLTLAVSEGGVPGGLFPKIQDVPLHIRGSYTRLGPIVPRGMPTFFAGRQQPKIASGSGRLELANWVASKGNPLTARVIVNRIWQGHFGTGLVRTANNFGLLSEPPTHPELLDWLATKFVEDGWSLKKLHRRILLSATYQQSSVAPAEAIARDPENRWLGRFTPRRLEAEAIRDSMLMVAGRLDATPLGPATHDLNVPCRSLYVQTARWDRSNFATLFDAANPDAAVEKRDVSTVAPQALFLLNHDFVRSQAQHLADRVRPTGPKDETAGIQHLFRLVFARPATGEEMMIALQMLTKPHKDGPASVWRDLAHVLLCSNEFVYLD
ncbi:MAG TPA: PSD1 and planctomycete cytochrome C domain-containing protein [Gemmataceae bacterium]|nr:PSD1 and planctomycete cytochrome C domain-containing protein [Gemmataceae bacterium]